ncbi:MAG TPA: hypothetical protein VND68_12460 [Chloroflexia bacterium]|nr:hypothetical protein [Chloroflexia bacterium]
MIATQPGVLLFTGRADNKHEGRYALDNTITPHGTGRLRTLGACGGVRETQELGYCYPGARPL